MLTLVNPWRGFIYIVLILITLLFVLAVPPESDRFLCGLFRQNGDPLPR